MRLHEGSIYIRPMLLQYATSLLQDKVLFGSNCLVLQFDRRIGHFKALGMKDEVRRKILFENARRVLKLCACERQQLGQARRYNAWVI